MLDKNTLLLPRGNKPTPIDVARWEECYAINPTAAHEVAIHRATKGKSTSSYTPLIIASVVDADGKPVFCVEDAARLEQLPTSELAAVGECCLKAREVKSAAQLVGTDGESGQGPNH